MIELIAGILIGGTIVTALWIMDLKHIVKHNAKIYQEIMDEAGRAC